MSTESLSRAANSTDLGFEEGVVHDVDRVAAMAGGNVLGGLLFRFAHAGQAQWGRRIVLILARRARAKTRIGREIAERVAAAALIEFTQPHCRTCLGARELVDEVSKVKVICSACGGVGKQRYGNHERRAAVGAYGSRIDDAFAHCHTEMSNALSAFLGHTYGRLQ